MFYSVPISRMYSHCNLEVQIFLMYLYSVFVYAFLMRFFLQDEAIVCLVEVSNGNYHPTSSSEYIFGILAPVVVHNVDFAMSLFHEPGFDRFDYTAILGN